MGWPTSAGITEVMPSVDRCVKRQQRITVTIYGLLMSLLEVATSGGLLGGMSMECLFE